MSKMIDGALNENELAGAKAIKAQFKPYTDLELGLNKMFRMMEHSNVTTFQAPVILRYANFLSKRYKSLIEDDIKKKGHSTLLNQYDMIKEAVDNFKNKKILMEN